jgi:hypothetical protein
MAWRTNSTCYAVPGGASLLNRSPRPFFFFFGYVDLRVKSGLVSTFSITRTSGSRQETEKAKTIFTARLRTCFEIPLDPCSGGAQAHRFFGFSLVGRSPDGSRRAAIVFQNTFLGHNGLHGSGLSELGTDRYACP